MAKKKIILMKENGEMDKWKVKENSLILPVSMKEMSKEERDQVMESIISVMATAMRDNGLITTKKAKESSPIKKEEISTLDSLAKANSMVMVSITTNQLASSILVNNNKKMIKILTIADHKWSNLTFDIVICSLGEWDNDAWSGLGKFLDADHKVVKCGVWKNDKFESAKDEKEVIFP